MEKTRGAIHLHLFDKDVFPISKVQTASQLRQAKHP